MKTQSTKTESTAPPELKPAFTLACRYLGDYLGCPPECESYSDNCKKDPWICWQGYLRARGAEEAICRVCGCTQNNACEEGCYWVESDLCSHCAGKRRVAAR